MDELVHEILFLRAHEDIRVSTTRFVLQPWGGRRNRALKGREATGGTSESRTSFLAVVGT